MRATKRRRPRRGGQKPLRQFGQPCFRALPCLKKPSHRCARKYSSPPITLPPTHFPEPVRAPPTPAADATDRLAQTRSACPIPHRSSASAQTPPSLTSDHQSPPPTGRFHYPPPDSATPRPVGTIGNRGRSILSAANPAAPPPPHACIRPPVSLGLAAY